MSFSPQPTSKLLVYLPRVFVSFYCSWGKWHLKQTCRYICQFYGRNSAGTVVGCRFITSPCCLVSCWNLDSWSRVLCQYVSKRWKVSEMCSLSFFNKTYFQKNVSMYPVLGHLETPPGVPWDTILGTWRQLGSTQYQNLNTTYTCS